MNTNWSIVFDTHPFYMNKPDAPQELDSYYCFLPALVVDANSEQFTVQAKGEKGVRYLTLPNDYKPLRFTPYFTFMDRIQKRYGDGSSHGLVGKIGVYIASSKFLCGTNDLQPEFEGFSFERTDLKKDVFMSRDYRIFALQGYSESQRSQIEFQNVVDLYANLRS